MPTPHNASGSSRESFAHGGNERPPVTRWSTASSAIRCRFVYGITRLKVLSRVPSAVLSSRRPPFLDRIPARPVLRRHQYYEGATTSHSRIPGHLFVSLPGPTRFLLGSCSPLPALPGGVEVPPQAKIIVQPVISNCRRAFTWTRVGPLRFPDDPSRASAPFQDPGRTDAPSPITVASGAAPAPKKAKAPAC